MQGPGAKWEAPAVPRRGVEETKGPQNSVARSGEQGCRGQPRPFGKSPPIQKKETRIPDAHDRPGSSPQPPPPSCWFGDKNIFALCGRKETKPLGPVGAGPLAWGRWGSIGRGEGPGGPRPCRAQFIALAAPRACVAARRWAVRYGIPPPLTLGFLSFCPVNRRWDGMGWDGARSPPRLPARASAKGACVSTAGGCVVEGGRRTPVILSADDETVLDDGGRPATHVNPVMHGRIAAGWGSRVGLECGRVCLPSSGCFVHIADCGLEGVEVLRGCTPFFSTANRI